MSTSFWKSGHVPTLFAAFLYFDLSFMVWYLLGPLAVQIAADLQLSAQQRGLMVATPILAGAILRFAMGVLVDRLSPKTAGLIGQVVVIVALAAAWHLGVRSYEQALLLGVFLGFAGASFAVSLPLASQWLAMLPYVATIVALVLISKRPAFIRVNMPASLGKPFHPT